MQHKYSIIYLKFKCAKVECLEILACYVIFIINWKFKKQKLVYNYFRNEHVHEIYALLIREIEMCSVLILKIIIVHLFN